MVTFQILFATTGRKSLVNMLNSVKDQLTSEDAITIVFDEVSNNLEPSVLKDCKAEVVVYEEPFDVNRSFRKGGEVVRDKYKIKLKRRDFVLHADDDDIFIDNSLNKLRLLCQDTSCLYMAPMVYSWDLNHFVPDIHQLLMNHVTTQNGIIPFDINLQGNWGHFRGGDGYFYQNIAPLCPKVRWFDPKEIILQMFRPDLLNHDWKLNPKDPRVEK